MSFPHLFRSSILLAGGFALWLVPACRESEPSKSRSSPASKSRKAKPLDKPLAGVDKAVEDFTGAHTRIVWAEYQRSNNSDTFANSDELVLKGLDTRDGRGERMIQDRLDNYSRPVLTSDGEVILFTDKEVSRKRGRKHYDPDIYRTDWEDAKPVRIAEGYAVDCWRDPVTGVEWVYAARDFKAGKSLSLEALRLVRFPLDEPAKEEIVYDDGPISPDNIQFSRDGSQASCLFPWPNVGVLSRGKDGKFHARKLLTGCWPSFSPDNSHVAWVFDGGHRGATFFGGGREKPWTVDFNKGPGMGGRELYHPRWSNHPRFLALSGPYVPVKNQGGNVINKGGASADIHIGRFSENLDKVEAWLQVTHDKLSESFPDVWVEGGEDVQLAAFAPGLQKPGDEDSKTGAWPAIDDSLVFLWLDRSALNHFRGRDGKLHASVSLEPSGAARYGRLEEMLVDGGQFQAALDEDSPLRKAMSARQEITVEMMLMPDVPATGRSVPVFRHLFRGPNFTLALAPDGNLIAAQDRACVRSTTTLPAKPFHLTVIRRGAGFSVFIDGTPVTMTESSEAPPAAGEDALILGGGWEGGISGVAIHQRSLGPGEVTRQAVLQLARAAALPPAPPRVRVLARLVESSAMPSAEGIAPYTGSLVACVYELEKVLEGRIKGKRVLVKHWAMLDQKAVHGFPREAGKSYELLIEREADHPHLKGERVMDDTTAFDLEAWFDVTPPRIP